jgi:hypothetical protein
MIQISDNGPQDPDHCDQHQNVRDQKNTDYNKRQCFGSGSRRAKMAHKNRKSKEISCFEVPDVPF